MKKETKRGARRGVARVASKAMVGAAAVALLAAGLAAGGAQSLKRPSKAERACAANPRLLECRVLAGVGS